MKKSGSTKTINCLKLAYDNLAGNRYSMNEAGIECMISAIASEFKEIYSKNSSRTLRSILLNSDENKLAPIIVGRLLNKVLFIGNKDNNMMCIDNLFIKLFSMDFAICDRKYHYKNNKVNINIIVNDHIHTIQFKISMKKLQKIWDNA